MRTRRSTAKSTKQNPQQPNKSSSLTVLSAKLTIARAVLLIALLAILAYANSLGGDFVFDDTDQIVSNQSIRSWDNISKAFTSHVWAFRESANNIDAPPPLPYYRPLFTVMLTTEYHLFGLWPQGWHLVSMLLHILCSIGVFYVILAASSRKLIALAAASLFAVHPIHVESVAWISGMTDPLFGVFFLASLFFYLKSRAPSDAREKQRSAFWLSIGLFLVAAFAKETALSLVLLIFGYELVSGAGSFTKRLIASTKRAAPLAAASLVYLTPRYLVLQDLMWRNPQAPDRPIAQTFLTIPSVLCSYAEHLVWPFGLSVTHDTRFVTNIASVSFVIPAAALGSVAAALFVYRKRISREVWLALLLTLVPLLPVLNLGQIAREEYLVFDHYLYLSVAGLGYLVAIGVEKLSTSRSSDQKIFGVRRAAVALSVFLILVIGLGAATARENKPWSDSYSLWSHVASLRPQYWAAPYNAGLALIDEKRFSEARASLERANELKPDEPIVLNALGRALDGAGDPASAVVSFKRAIDLKPDMFESYNDLGTVYFKQGEYASAEASFSTALRLKPEATASRFNLALCYSGQGRFSDAARELERVVREKPDDGEALYELGLAYEKAGKIDDAASAYRRGENVAKSSELSTKLEESLSRIHGANPNR